MIQKSEIFKTKIYKTLEKKIGQLLNEQADFLTPRTAQSPRAVGDAIEDTLTEHFGTLLGGLCEEYSPDFARRAMADFAFKDKNGFYYIVDVKTHRLDTHFNMPNLTSVERLSRLYEDDKNYFVVLKVDYKVDGLRSAIDKVTFVPIEFLAWDCLTIGALGWGQIQIANANTISVLPNNKRKDWMIEMCDTLLNFYPKEIAKINGRINHFKEVRSYWESREE